MRSLQNMFWKFAGMVSLIFSSFIVVGQTSSDLFLEMNKFEIDQVDFNTTASEFGPSYIEGALWFSAYTDKHIKKIENGNPNKTFYSLFKIPTDSNAYIDKKERVLIRDLNSGFHEGPVSYCSTTGELFVTLSNTVKIDVEIDGIIVKKQVVRLRLVVCKKIDGRWVIQGEMPFNDPVYSVGQPAVSVTGDTLFFASDIPSLSKGGTDIFMVIRKDSVWGLPVSLDKNINTSGNEMFPFFHPSGMLFFASNGRPGGKGGLDLFVSDLLFSDSSMPKPLVSFNTQYDDFGLVIHESGMNGYFVSNRPGKYGDDDIYRVKIKNTYTNLSGIVVDDETGNPLSGANIDIYDCADKKLEKIISDTDGKFKINVLKGKCYKVRASSLNYIENIKQVTENEQVKLRLKRQPSLELELLVSDFDNRAPVKDAVIRIGEIEAGKTSANGIFEKSLTDEKELNVNIIAQGYLNQSVKISLPEKGKVQQSIFLMKMELNKTFVLDNIYYDLNSWKILPSSEIELNKLVKIMKENPTIKIELGSHTDSRGSDQYNLTLSQKRSESAVAYIIKNGISKERIVAKGYGETKLLNLCKNGVTCTDDEHRINRRTEFKIIGFVK